MLVVYFHIANILFKRISNRFYIQVKDMIALTKEVFEGDHNTDFSSVDRMDIINLAGIHKYNALSVFQRVIHKLARSTVASKSSRPNLVLASSLLSKKTCWCMPIRKVRRPSSSTQKRKKGELPSSSAESCCILIYSNSITKDKVIDCYVVSQNALSSQRLPLLQLKQVDNQIS